MISESAGNLWIHNDALLASSLDELHILLAEIREELHDTGTLCGRLPSVATIGLEPGGVIAVAASVRAATSLTSTISRKLRV